MSTSSASASSFSFPSTSPSIHSILCPSQLALELEGYKIRDLLLGQNNVLQDICCALKLATVSVHPVSQYLAKIFAGKSVTTKAEARQVFVAQGFDDPIGLCFAGVIMSVDTKHWDLERISRSAYLGFAFAQALMAEASRGAERFKFANASAAQHERDGFRWLGACFWMGSGCTKNLKLAQENYLIAAELGHVEAMSYLGKSMDDMDPRRWVWWGRAAQCGMSWNFLNYFSHPVCKFKSGSGSAAVVFVIGRALNGWVDGEKRQVFGERSGFDKFAGLANDCIAFYKLQLDACRRAVDTWILVGIRFGVAKDIRSLIAQMIWDSRELALHRVTFGVDGAPNL